MKYHLFFLVLFLSSVFAKAQNGEIYYIDLSNLTAGIYLIKTTDRNGSTITERIIKL